MCSDKWEQEQMQDQAEVSARLLSASVRLEIMQLHNLFQSVCQTFILALFFFSTSVLLHLWEQRKEREMLHQTTLMGRSALLHLFHWMMN